MPTIQEVFGPQLDRLLTQLNRQAAEARVMNSYYEGTCPFPRAVTEAKIERAYQTMMSMATAPWAALTVDSVQDRLEVGGIASPANDRADVDRLWGVWQDNAMDAESKLGHAGALVDGRAFATVWPAESSPRNPEIVLDGADQMVVEYVEGRHQPRYRTAALRRWCEGSDDKKVDYVTLYRPDGLHRFRSVKQASPETVAADGTVWEPYSQPNDGDVWPVPNPYGRVPVVELGVNRRLKAGPFPYARGEFQHCTGLIDQINLLTFLGLVVAIYMGFPLTYASGIEMQRRLLKDDDGNPLLDDDGKQKVEVTTPIKRRPDDLVVIEDPQGKLGQLQAADRKNLSVFDELDQLATITKTPRHYFPMQGGFSSISADAIRASEGGLHAKVKGLHQPSLGEGWEEVLRLAGLMLDEPVELAPNAQVRWLDHESRSVAEMADAATKVASIGFPLTTVAERYLRFNQDDLNRLRADVADGALSAVFAAAASTPTVPANMPNGNVPVGVTA